MLNSRRPKPQLDDYEASHYEGEELEDAPGSSEDGNSDGAENDIEESEEESEEDTAQTAISQISFGALAKAASSLSRDRRKPSSTTKATSLPPREAPKPKTSSKDPHHRASKNAPQELSSKRAVTRRRDVVEPALRTKPVVRDPRFDSAVNGRFDERTFRKNYGFLDSYREDEMKMLKTEISKTKEAEKRAKLERKLKSMESQKQSQENKDKVAEVVKEHKKKEKELVKQGKKPFHLKQSSIKKLVLTEKYSGMNEKQLEKVVERKQKRKAQKERKNIPFARRDAI